MSIFGPIDFTNLPTRIYCISPNISTEDKYWHLLVRMWYNAKQTIAKLKYINESEWPVLFKTLYFGEYKKYFCDQINILHTASTHKTNTVTTSSHNKASNFIFCFWQHSHKSDNIFQGYSYVLRKKTPNTMVWRWNKGYSVSKKNLASWFQQFLNFKHKIATCSWNAV